jgi:hypothetical protein
VIRRGAARFAVSIPQTVMVGLVPTIHVFFCRWVSTAPRKSWMVATSATMTMA